MDVPRKNMKWWDRVFRFGAAIPILAWAIAGGPWWAYLSLIPMTTSSFGFCPLYWALRKSEDNPG